MSVTTLASRIRVLPEALVNKIAAGEVVERPASVVKELVENALDAGATRIATTIEDGGKQLIRVTDDGCGMTADDLRLAIAAHATSKLNDEDDLYRISTMGFRGEALASISSVSKLRIVSRTHESFEGHEVHAVAEQIETSRAAGCPPGTTVEVRDLFFNVPARRKFLRTSSAESGHVSEQITRLALARYEVAFELTSNKRTAMNLPIAERPLDRIGKLFGPELASAMLHLTREERGLRLEAFASPPAQSRATAQWQYAFVNGRYVRDRFVQHAIKESYRGLMEPNRHGVVFLFLTLDPTQIDVNVHPTKIEVRWADSGLVHSQVLSALREAFQRADLSPSFRTSAAKPAVDEAEQERIRQEMAAWFKSVAPVRGGDPLAATMDSPNTNSPSPRPRADGEERDSAGSGWRAPVGNLGLDAWRELYATPPNPPRDGSKSPESAALIGRGEATRSWDSSTGSAARDDAPAEAAAREMLGAMLPLPSRAVQMHNLYLVAETAEGIIIVDQHALHERVIYEQLRRRMTNGILESQRLLLPETVRVNAREIEVLESNRELLERLGIDVTPFGADSVAVHSFPSLLRDTDVPGFMRNLVDRLSDRSGETGAEVVLDAALAMMACKAAVKAGDPLAPEEIEALIGQRHLLDTPSACPHGRPTTLRLTKNDLNRQFHRT